MKRAVSIVVVVGAAAGLGAMALGLPASSSSGKPSPLARALAPAVSVVLAREREIAQTLAVSGTLVPREEVLVTPEIEGHRLTEVLVEEGARVRRGEVLARMSHDLVDVQLAQQKALVDKAAAAVPQAESNIDQAAASETEARLSLERARQLMQSGNSTAATMEARIAAARQAASRLVYARNGLDVAKADLAQARALRDELELRLSRTEVRAPEAGIVSRRNARVGMLASAAGEPLFRIIARGEIELEGEVVGDELPKLREGAPAWIEVGDGERIAGSIRDVYPEVDRATRLGKVRVRLDADARLRIGAFARGGVEIGRVMGVAVPQAAILHDGERRSSVLVAKGDALQARMVRTGLSDDDDVQVVAGLAAGERVVGKAGSFLRDGDRIEPVLSADAAPTARTAGMTASAEAR